MRVWYDHLANCFCGMFLHEAHTCAGTPVGLQVSVEFLSDNLLAVLNDAQLYRYVTDEFPRSITSYYARVLQSIDELRKYALV